ncbi:DUF1223 domain-containing protein [Pedobacter sandarakinus]|uniref:DUF1223 domain-containing protein n=1 Tax=Pedobacter sandarakinus TaxID=353156 RepID=UPI002246B39A|nr:DUF1223 domain-containing protein [Pedobacter sandarakinus]MCX2573187.1 DUF1223 domain-containing protein [Pedobacter sandarakinus]
MKRITLIATLILSVGLISLLNAADKPPVPKSSPVVLELFTSEGCSSCPPADALIAKINREFKGEEVFILTYHVDYWNRLGWKDPFSKPAYSARQYQYGDYFKLGSIYTPQLIVNGAAQFVGSDERRLRSELAKNTSSIQNAKLSIDDIVVDKNTAKVSFSVVDANPNDEIKISLVQKVASSNVLNGENRGLKLSHVQVVRDQQTLPSTAKAKTVLLQLPSTFDPTKYEIIGFVQSSGVGKISGATRKSF